MTPRGGKRRAAASACLATDKNAYVVSPEITRPAPANVPSGRAERPRAAIDAAIADKATHRTEPPDRCHDTSQPSRASL